MKTGWMTFKQTYKSVDGADVQLEVTKPCEVYDIRDGRVFFKVGTVCKRGSYPNIHKYLNVRGADLMSLSVTECVFDDSRPVI